MPDGVKSIMAGLRVVKHLKQDDSRSSSNQGDRGSRLGERGNGAIISPQAAKDQAIKNKMIKVNVGGAQNNIRRNNESGEPNNGTSNGSANIIG